VSTTEGGNTQAPAAAGQPEAWLAGRPGFAQRYLTPKEAIPRVAAVTLALACFALVVGIWAILSYGGLVREFFLPGPGKVANTLYSMFAEEGFAHDVWASFYRIGLGFLISAAIAIPLGIAIGSFRAVQAFFEPLIAAVRYMPASAFIPLLIIWFGIGNTEKVAVIYIGVFFPLTLMVADVSANIPKELLHIAYTLGASRWQVFRRVLLPASWPGVVDNLRIGIGWAWTYLIVAELVAASTGIGHVILSASRFLQTDKVIAGILTIGILGLLTDAFFRWLYRALFPYAERVAR
jgi:NitT/TauT family transport system permease protein